MSMIDPSVPPAIESMLNASVTIVAIIDGTAPMFITTTMMPTMR